MTANKTIYSIMLKLYPLKIKHNKDMCLGLDHSKLMKRNSDLQNLLFRTKNLINNQKKWDIAKKFTNEYEFIFSFNNEGIADVNPISRSYFKMIEILIDRTILDPFENSETTACCLCEGPGGFVQAINEIAQRIKCRLSPIHCVTLISKEKKIPNWKLQQLSNYKLHFGKDGTGDIYNIDNIDDVVSKVNKNSIYLITADGGFDFSADFNSQEIEFQQLLLSEIYTALLLQKKGGVFVVKVYDLFDINTIRLLSLLHLVYEKVDIYKPKSSRPANSEKYLLCSNYQVDKTTTHMLESLRNCIIQRNLKSLDNILKPEYVHRVQDYIFEYNTLYVENQIAYINNTLNVIKFNSYFDKNQHIEKCKEWCIQYGIPIKHESLVV